MGDLMHPEVDNFQLLDDFPKAWLLQPPIPPARGWVDLNRFVNKMRVYPEPIILIR
jgi:hypothetical protein